MALKYTAYDTGYYVSGCDSTDTEITIPAEYKGTRVGGIEDEAFSYNTKLTSVTFSYSASKLFIGAEAFSSCTNLTSVTFGSRPIVIGDYAFSNCDKITSLEIPTTVTQIGEGALSGCDGLTSLTLPYLGANTVNTSGRYLGYIFGATSADDQRYYLPPKLDELTIHKGALGSKAFYGLEAKTVNLISVTSIGSSAFRYYSNLTSIVIPDSVTSIGDYAFYECSGLTSITIPDSVTSLGKEAFYNCSSLTTAIVGNGVTTIKDNTFLGCNLQSLELGSSLTSIGTCAFYKNNNLTSVVIPASVTQIEHSAFHNCGLTSIELPEGLVELGTRVFSGCPITDLVIPNSVTEFGYDSLDPDAGPLDGCDYLVNLTVPFLGDVKNGNRWWVHVLGYLFRGNTAVDLRRETVQDYADNSTDTYYIPASLKSVKVTGSKIKYGAFSNCAGLTSIDISETTISDSSLLFKGCTSLTTVKLPESMTSIGRAAFYACTSLSGTLTLPEKITTIGNQAFDLSTGTNSTLTSLIIPHKISTMGENAFGNFSELTLYMKDRGPGANWSETWNYYNIPVVWQYDVDVTCSIDFDYDLIQDDCHWDLDRYFKFTFKFLDPALEYSAVGYYRIGDYVEVPTGKTFTEKGYKILNDSAFYKRNNTWIYHLGVSDLDQTDIINNRDGEGNLKITAVVKTNEDIAHETFSKYLELPPTLAAVKPNSTLPNVQTDYVQTNPGEFVCTWNPATVADCDDNNLHGVDTVDGYCIEILRKPAGSETFSKIYGLTWSDFYLTLTGSLQRYKLTKDSTDNYTEYIPTDNPLDFVLKTKSSSSQVYIENPLKTEFYFTPKDIGIESGDSYKILIYPYSHYEGALISTEGISSDGIDVPKGIVRVKTANGWVEGQVWVMTESGWKNAEVIYAKTADGWKEAQ
jgi:hypothetical protein